MGQVTAGRTRDIAALAAAVDLLPTPTVLMERGTAAVLFANRAAHALAGGEFPMPQDAAGFEDAYRLYDATGEPVPASRAPGVRAARGERIVNEPIDWHTAGNGWRSLIVSADTVTDAAGEPLVVATFEDVTDLRSAERSERRVREELEAILAGVSEAVVAQGLRGEIVYANPAAVAFLGYASADELREAPPAEVRERMAFFDEHRRPVSIGELPGHSALAGEEPEPVVLRFRPPAGGPERWARLKAHPLRDEKGRVRMAINVVEDITELKQAEQEQRFLADAGRVLTSSLDYERTLQTVAALAVPEIADWCVVDLRTADGFERVAVAHADPAKVRWVEEISRRYPPNPHASQGVAEVLRTGRAEHYPEIPDEMLVATAVDDEHLRLIREVGMVSAMCVPMIAAGETVGAVTMVSAESGRRFTGRELMLAKELGLRAGAAIENARLYRQRSEIAKTLQASLLPPQLPAIERLETTAVYRPAGEGMDVGGDFYDLFTTGDDVWYAVVGDVCGKGPEAAATTAMVRYTLRATAVGGTGPADVLHALNDAMLRQATGALRFCTLAVVRLDLSRPAVRVSSAIGGHPLPRLLRAGGGGIERVGAPGTAVGITEDIEVAPREAELATDDVLLIFTDGIVEARAPEVIWSMDDVDAQLAAVAGLPLDELVAAFTRAATGEAGTPLRDDLAVLALKVRPPGGPPSAPLGA